MHNNATIVKRSLTNEKRVLNSLIFFIYRAIMILLPDKNLVQKKNSVKLRSEKHLVN
jgi:hypothetical protein